MCGFGNDSANIYDINSPQSSSLNVLPMFHNNAKVNIRALFPVIGFRSHGDRVTLNGKSQWTFSNGNFGKNLLKACLQSDQLFRRFGATKATTATATATATAPFPHWFIKKSFDEYNEWRSSNVVEAVTRANILTKFDTRIKACVEACRHLGARQPFLSGDIVKIKRSNGRILEMPEEAGEHANRTARAKELVTNF